MENLRNMFPSLSIDLIRSTYDKMDGKVEAAVDKLLQLSDSTTPPMDKSHPSAGNPPARTSCSAPYGPGNAGVHTAQNRGDFQSSLLPVTTFPNRSDWDPVGGVSTAYPGAGHGSTPGTTGQGTIASNNTERISYHGYGDEQRTSSDEAGRYGAQFYSGYSAGVDQSGRQAHNSAQFQPSTNLWPMQNQGNFQTSSSWAGSVAQTQPASTTQLSAYSSSTSQNDSGSKAYHVKDPPYKSPAHSSHEAKKLILMRGLPGSGKSTLARKLEGNKGIVCSTDDFFYENGRYAFDPSKLTWNHDRNKSKAERAMHQGFSPVIIDNTNLTCQEMDPYVALGLLYGYSIELKESDTTWRYDCAQLARRNSHDIPEDRIQRMWDRFDRRVTAEVMIFRAKRSETPKPKPLLAGQPYNRTFSGDGLGSSVQPKLPRPFKSPSLPRVQTTDRAHSTAGSQTSQTSFTSSSVSTWNAVMSSQQPFSGSTTQNVSSVSSINAKSLGKGDTSAESMDQQVSGQETRSKDTSEPVKPPLEPAILDDLPSPMATQSFHHSTQSGVPLMVSKVKEIREDESLPLPMSFSISSSGQTSTPAMQWPDVSALESASDPPATTFKPVQHSTGTVWLDECAAVSGSDIGSREPHQSSDGTRTSTSSSVPVAAARAPMSQVHGSLSFAGLGTSCAGLGTFAYAGTSTSSGNSTGDRTSSAVESCRSDSDPHPASLNHPDSTSGGYSADFSQPGPLLPLLHATTASRSYMDLTTTDEVPTNSTNADKPVVVCIDSDTGNVYSGDDGSIDSEALAFLKSCFPDPTDSFLLHCWECSHHNIDDCISMIFDLQDGQKNKQSKPEEDQVVVTENIHGAKMASGSKGPGLATSSSTQQPVYCGPSTMQSNYGGTISSISDTDPAMSCTSVQILNDSELASKLHASLNRGYGDTDTTETASSVGGVGPAAKPPGVEDEGLVLKLTPSLAHKLVDMFGSLRHLVDGDELSEEDLRILLSEDVARSVHGVWKQTLQSKRDEIAVRKQLQNPSTSLFYPSDTSGQQQQQPGGLLFSQPASPSKRARKGKRGARKKPENVAPQQFLTPSIPSTHSAWQPPAVLPGMPGVVLGPDRASDPYNHGVSGAAGKVTTLFDQQQGEDMQTDEYTAMLEEWMKGNTALSQKVNDLRQKFPKALPKIVSALLIDSGLDFDYIEVYLTNDDTDGNAIKPSAKPVHPLSTPVPSPHHPSPSTSGSTAEGVRIVPSANPQPFTYNSTYASPPAVTYNSSYASPQRNHEGTTESKDEGNSSWMYQQMGSPQYRDFRAEAQQHADLWHEQMQKAGKAFGQKQGELAAYYREKGQEHKLKMHEANRRAAEMIYLKNAAKQPHNTIDLHGLHVEEALQILAEKLLQSSGEIEVITGRGLHSHGNIPKLKKAVINYLYQHRIQYYIPPENPGAVRVRVPANMRYRR